MFGEINNRDCMERLRMFRKSSRYFEGSVAFCTACPMGRSPSIARRHHDAVSQTPSYRLGEISKRDCVECLRIFRKSSRYSEGSVAFCMACCGDWE
jgi:hypothetical protein